MDPLSGVFGGCFGFIAVTWFAAAGHLTKYTIFVEDDLVALRREFQGIPVGSRKLYAKVVVTDLGVYPIDLLYIRIDLSRWERFASG